MPPLTTNFVENLIAASGELQLMVPECEKGIGNVILSPEAQTLIDGVKVKSIQVWPDDRGYFLEILRTGQGLPAHFDLTHTQVSAALTYPAAIKAFHYHQHQTDCWMAIAGMLQVALVHLRYGVRNTMYVGALRPWQILIPPGVAHGYKVISLDPSILVYATDQYYNPADEGRIPHNHPSIAYDWELEHK
jgi:dTDP-4-dehydrorhamnose 3,5-epimerase